MHDPVLMLPEPERRTWLLGALADLLSSAPWRHFVAAPIVLPRPSHFPERWSPDVRGVRRLIRRLLRFSDLDLTAHVELFEGRPPQVDSLGLRLVLVILGAASLAAVAVPRSPIALALVAVLATLAVLATGHYRHPRCSAPACQSPLTRDAAACPRCGAVIAGDLDFADQRLAAEQALRDR